MEDHREQGNDTVVDDLKILLEKVQEFKRNFLSKEEEIFTRSDRFSHQLHYQVPDKFKKMTNEFVSITEFSLTSILKKQSKYKKNLQAEFDEELRLHKDKFSQIIETNLDHMQYCERKMMNYLELLSSKYLTQLEKSEQNLNIMMAVMKDHDAKKKFQKKIKNLFGFNIGNKDEKENNMNMANRVNINNSILSSIRKNSIFESDKKSKKGGYNFKEKDSHGLIGFTGREVSSGRGVRFSSERESDQDRLIMNFLNKSGKLKKLGKAIDKYESLTSSKIMASGRKEGNSIIGASAEKRARESFKKGFGRGSGKKASRYDIPDFTLDSPKTNNNMSSKMIIDENFDSAERDFKHVVLEDVLDARSLPISLKEESQILEDNGSRLNYLENNN